MKASPQMPSSEELQKQREAIRRGLLRANTAAVLILLVVIGLALAAVLEASRAGRESARAVSAERDARERLRDSYLAQVRALRQSGTGGRRLDSLDAITKAKEISLPGVSSRRATLELRNEAAACLALSDLRSTTLRPGLPATNVTVEASGERYAVVDEHGAVQVRRLVNDEFILEVPSQLSPVESLNYFSPKGQFLPVRYADGQTLVWQLDRREAVFKTQTRDEFRSLDFSPDDRRLAVEDANGSLLVCDLRSGAIQTLMTNLPWVRPCFSPDGQKLLIASGSKSNALILEVESGRILAELPHPSGVLSGAWHPQGDWLATGCTGSDIYLWRPDERKPFRILSGHQGGVAELAFHPGGDLLVSASWDGTLRLWDLTTGEGLINTLGGGAPKFCAAGRRLMCYWGNDSLFKTYELATERICRFLHVPESGPGEGSKLPTAPSGSWSIQFSPDERLLVSSHPDGVRLWDAASAELLVHVPGTVVVSAFFSSRGDQLFTSGHDGLLCWPVSELLKPGGPPRTAPERLDGSGSDFNRACPSADGQEVAYACGSQIRLLNSHLKLEGPPPLNCVALSPNKQWVAASPWARFGVRLWNASTGQRVQDFAFSSSIFVAFTPDSRWLVTGAGNEYCFWDVKTCQPGRRISRHDATDFLGALSFSPDGKLLAVAISRTVVELLDASTFEPLVLLQTPTPQMISWIAFSPSSKQLAVATSTPFIQLWDLVMLRGELARLGLDWGPAGASVGSSISDGEKGAGVGAESIGAVSSNATKEQGVFLALALGAVALTILLALSVLKRQWKLVQSYRQIDDLATQRAGELEVAQRELLHSEKMKALGTLAAGIAHDFNNLLSVIRLSNDIIGQEAGNKPGVREEIESIENAVQQGRLVVRSMLGYSREAADQPTCYVVGDVVADTVSLLSKQFLGGIVLTLDVDQLMPPVWGAPSRLEQILLNLIVNAAEAMKGHGQLTIQARTGKPLLEQTLVLRPVPAAHYVQVSVRDSGPGIAPGVRPRIFEPFFTTKIMGTTPGTGLGLSTVYTIAQQDGLGLAMETVLEQGTTFQVWIPIIESKGGAAGSGLDSPIANRKPTDQHPI